MKTHLTFTNIVIALLFAGQCYLMYKINERPQTDYTVLDNVIKSNNEVIESGKKLQDVYDAGIARQTDTIKVYNNTKTILRENYNSDIARVLSSDSTELRKGYLIDINKSERMFEDGYYTTQ
jgi:hypothetical protein